VNFGCEEFLEVKALGANPEKLRPGMAQGLSHDPFRRRLLRCGGADIGVEIEPGDAPEIERQALHESLRDEPQLNVSLISGQLAAEVLPVAF